jgi:hypothetical protein
MSVLLTVTTIGKNNLERCGSARLLPFFSIYFLPLIYFSKVRILPVSFLIAFLVDLNTLLYKRGFIKFKETRKGK